MKTLKDAKIGETVEGGEAARRRPREAPHHGHGHHQGRGGVRPQGGAALGDPIEVTVRGYELSLRKADAEMIEVQ